MRKPSWHIERSNEACALNQNLNKPRYHLPYVESLQYTTIIGTGTAIIEPSYLSWDARDNILKPRLLFEVALKALRP